MRACVRACVCVCVCVRACVRVCVCCFGGADGCISPTMLEDVCQCCRLLMLVCLPLFYTLSLLFNFVNKDSESESNDSNTKMFIFMGP